MDYRMRSRILEAVSAALVELEEGAERCVACDERRDVVPEEISIKIGEHGDVKAMV